MIMGRKKKGHRDRTMEGNLRFCVYKVTRRGDETYIPRSLDVTELIELIKESISRKVFSKGFIEMLKQEISKI